MIDLYCERLGPGLWAEPLNAVSNLAFFVAAVVLLAFYLRMAKRSLVGLLLITLLFAIGIGSSLFHTFAEPWAHQADLIPILLFQLVYLGGYARSVMRIAWYGVVGLLLSFLLAGAVIGSLDLALNGSESYLAALIYLSVFAIYHYRSVAAEPWLLGLCVLTFTLSLTFRSLDMSLCGTLPMGTHFLWHLLNGLVLYLCGRAYLIAIR